MAKESGSQTTAVQVALRIRPLNDRDRAQPRFANLSHDDVLKIYNSTVQVVPHNKLFTFDHVFGTTSTQEEIFSVVGESLIKKFVEGYNITILAYGQTSSGKTYTMGTAANGGHNTADEGIVPRSMALLFDILNNNNDSLRPISPTSSISSSTSASNKSGSRLRPKSKIANRSSHIPQVPNSSHKTRFTVKVSFIEIYNEDLHDLLNSAPVEELPPITIREDTKGRIYWTGVKEVLVHSTDDVLYYLEQGTQNRATGSTDMNEKSSRSHAIFSVSLKQEKWMPSTNQHVEKKRPTSSMSSRSSKTPNTSRFLTAQQDEGEWLITTSKFHFVDLAGSERLKRTAAEGDRRKEGININAGLLALGNVISALADQSKKNKTHVPYRDSKLTRLLQDSLGGSATTLMIACASPVEYNLAETLNTLQYANRARSIKNKSEKNQVEEWMTTDNIELLRSLIGKLKTELDYVKSNASPTKIINWKEEDDDVNIDDDVDNETFHHQRMLIADLQRQLEELDGEASVTRERNRIVEKELQRIRLVESMMKDRDEQDDFQHLVEPVIEEYEKSVSKLESQLALTRAALNHSDIGYEEQQNKLTQLENLIRSQEQTISELRLRLGKILEREQSNEAYIQELESKLMKSASETTKDQEMLNDLKNKIMKFKETDENTEQYIHDLEKRLATGEADRSYLRTCIEDLESKIEAKERTNLELLKKLSRTNTDTNTEKLILKELDEVNAKFAELEKERDNLQLQVQSLEKANHRNSSSNNSVHDLNVNINESSTLDDELKHTAVSLPSKFINRKSLADEKETPSSIAALSLMQTELRVKEETERANKLQLTLDSLQYDHQETLKELDEVLQRYHETLEQLDFLERDSSSTTAHEEENASTPKSLDLSKEIAQAKEDAHEQEKRAYIAKIANLEAELKKQQDSVDRIQKLEHELSVANKQVQILKQMESDHKATAEVETILEKMDSPVIKEKEEELNKKLEAEKQQTKHWKTANNELKADLKKMAQDLDEKESYIVELKQKAEKNANHQAELQRDFDEASEQSSSLQKRLAETLASLTVLKLAHDGLLKKQNTVDDADIVSKNNLERQSLLEKHQSELLKVQGTIDEMNDVLRNTTLDKEAALEKISALEIKLKENAEQAQLSNYSAQERLVADHETYVQSLRKDFEAQTHDLTEKLASLETELDLSKNIHEETLVLYNQRLKDAAAQHSIAVLELEEHIQKLEAELANQQGITDVFQSQHVEQMGILQLELSNFKDLQAEQLRNLTEEHQKEIDLLKLENTKLVTEHEKLNENYDNVVQKLKSTQQELIQFQSIHAEHQTQIDDLRLEKQTLSDTHERAMSSHNLSISKQVSELQNELEQTKSNHAIEIIEYKQKISLNDEHKNESDLLKKENTRLITECEKLHKECNSTVQQLKSTQQELTQLQSIHAEHQLQIDNLSSEKQALSEAHKRAMNSQSLSISKQVSEFQNELEQVKYTHAAEIVGYKEKLAFLQAEKDALLKNLHETDSAKLEQLSRVEAELKAVNAKYQTDLESSKIENERVTKSQNDTIKKVNVLQEEHDQLKKTHVEQLLKLDVEHKQQLDDTVKSLQLELNRAKEETFGKHNDLSTLQSKLDTVKIDFKNKIDDLTGNIVRLESELTTANVTLAQQRQHEEETLLALKTLHSEQITDIHKRHLGELSHLESKQQLLETQLTKSVEEKEELSKDLKLLHTTHGEKEETIGQQRQMIEKYTNKIKELTEEISRLEFTARINNKNDEEQQQKLYQDRIILLEQQIKQIGEENIEYTSLSEELEKEIQRMTVEKEALADDLDICEEAIQLHQEKINEVKSLIGVMSDDDIVFKIKEMLKERSTCPVSETQSDQSSAKNNDILNNNNNNNNKTGSIGDGSGAISQQGPDSSMKNTDNKGKLEQEIIELKKELKNYQNQMKASRETMDKLLNDEKQKLDLSLKANQKLEKQLEELLKKKSSFMCF